MKKGIVLLAALMLAVLLVAATSRRAPAAYEVELRMEGYTGLVASPGCDAISDPNGYDVMTGVVRGVESADPTEDITYSGRLTRSTKIDYCLVKPAPTEDQVTYCVARLTGGALMEVTIEVYGDSGRGAWVKADPRTGQPLRVGDGGRRLQAG
jgi:hypothetical protein